MKNIDLILLAAGESSRLGRPKQLLPFGDKTLIEKLVEEALASKVRNTTIILGAYGAIIKEKLKNYQAKILTNKNFKMGMSSSIKKGIEYALKLKIKPDAVIIMLCDQPLVTSSIIDEMIEKYKASNASIINCNYGPSFGPPVLFDQSLYEELLDIQREDGAKEVVHRNRKRLIHIEFPHGLQDIDTESEYQDFILNNPHI